MDPQDLYGLPLEQFTDQRNELARELRRAGRREDAAAVSKLRKPSVAAWAVNQLVRTQRREFDELLNAGDALDQAQTDLLSNRGDAAALRRAVELERAAVERLADRARGLLNAEGHELTSPRLEQVTETLHAAALDRDARASVRDGCLERELRHVGLGQIGTAASRPSARTAARGRARQDDRAAERKAARQDERKTTRAAEREAARQDERKAARQAELEARRRLERAVKERDDASERRERAGEELRQAEQALRAARERAAAAEREHRQTKRRLDRA